MLLGINKCCVVQLPQVLQHAGVATVGHRDMLRAAPFFRYLHILHQHCIKSKGRNTRLPVCRNEHTTERRLVIAQLDSLGWPGMCGNLMCEI